MRNIMQNVNEGEWTEQKQACRMAVMLAGPAGSNHFTATEADPLFWFLGWLFWVVAHRQEAL